MAEIKWIKLSTDLFVNRKIKQIERRKDRSEIEIVWIKLLILAASINDFGKIYITREIPYDDESLAAELDRPENSVKTALDIFEQYGMIYRENGFIELTSWDKYQTFEADEDRREKARERKQRQRDREKMSHECHTDVTRDVTRDTSVTSRSRKEEKKKTIEKEQNEEGERECVTRDTCTAPLLPDEERMNPIFGIGKGLVLLSDNQMGRLVEDLSTAEIDHYIGVVADQLAKGKTYHKSHYQAIMDMAKQDRAV